MSYAIAVVGGMSALQQFNSGRMAQGQTGLQANQLEYQAKVENAAALQTAAMIRRTGRRQVGAVNAGYAAAGVKVGEGSALEAERYVEQGVEHDAFQAILDGSRRASGLNTEAKTARISGDMQATAGTVGAIGTLLSTGFQAYSKWRTMPSAGDGLSQSDRRKIGVF